ncbi:MAG: methyltransferase type 11 [Candidatus Margulisbacteria bacterium GWF2_35_9]|nr:MAG: methyltransferase type 11 [Candidatus Margulisbacteria bacterium GWF2_35_9]
MKTDYVHGYNAIENRRLQDQAITLVELLHSDTIYPKGSVILEAGCGVGAQTVQLAKNNPDAHIVSIDISEVSLTEARMVIKEKGITNVEFKQGDIFNLKFSEKSFDHVFICFVLEHLPDPIQALQCLRKLIKPGGTITVIEGDHGSVYFYPRNDHSIKAINCQIELQKKAGGNSLIGRELFPLLTQSGFKKCRVSPRMVYVDASKPELVEGFTKNTFTAMIEGIREKALTNNMIKEDIFDKGIKGLYRTTKKDGVFCYTFFKCFAEI